MKDVLAQLKEGATELREELRRQASENAITLWVLSAGFIITWVLIVVLVFVS